MTHDTLEISAIQTAEECTLVLRGWIDEESKFPPIDFSKNLRLDLGGVTHINSIGLRKFHSWLVQMKPSSRITLEGCPICVTNLFGNLTIFQTLKIEVVSFFVPFFSPATNEEKFVLFRLGHEFSADGTLSIPEVVDSKGEAMEMDADERTYKRFITSLTPQRRS
jgi:hypothetical protein